MKIGAVPYLNGKPLVYGLDREPEIELITDVPSNLARMLRDGEIAAGLVSVFACFENSLLEMVSEISISCDGPAESVRIFLREPISKVRTVALDTSSLTSVMLARIILRERYGLLPEFVSMPPDLDLMLGRCDAAVVIGDTTMTAPLDRWPSLDLGEEWRNLTELPFVFAVWAVNPGIATPDLIDSLTRARERGLSSLQEISESESKRLDLPVEICHRYLSRIMSYDLSERHLEAIDLFRRKSLVLRPDLRADPVQVFGAEKRIGHR